MTRLSAVTLFNLYAEHIILNAGLGELKMESRQSGETNNLTCADNTTLMAESEEELKGFLTTVKEESERAGLRLNVRKTKIKAAGLITSWQIEGGKVEVVTDFLFLGCKITADGDCSPEIRRQLFLGRKSMINLDCIENQRHYSANKGPYSQG